MNTAKLKTFAAAGTLALLAACDTSMERSVIVDKEYSPMEIGASDTTPEQFKVHYQNIKFAGDPVRTSPVTAAFYGAHLVGDTVEQSQIRESSDTIFREIQR